MWTVLKWKAQVAIIAGLTISLYVAFQYLHELYFGEHISPLKTFTGVLFCITTVFVVVFNLCWRRVWRWFPSLSNSFFPDLNGTWKGSLQTTWKDADGNTPGPIETTIWIKQTLVSISVTQQTKESVSHSNRMLAERDPKSGIVRLWFDYYNKPNAEVSYRSEQHEGVCGLEQHPERDRNALTGRYYTSRQTSGDIQVRRKSLR